MENKKIIEQLKNCSNEIWTEFKNLISNYDPADADAFWASWYNKMCEIDNKYDGTQCERLQQHLWTGLTESFCEVIKIE